MKQHFAASSQSEREMESSRYRSNRSLGGDAQQRQMLAWPRLHALSPGASWSSRQQSRSSEADRRGRSCFGPIVLLFTCLVTCSGCSLFVMAGKMLFGDPKMPSAFRLKTGINLEKDDYTVAVVCQTPEAIRLELPSLNFDLTEAIQRRLELRGIHTVDADDIADWLDDYGGRIGPLTTLADRFKPDVIVVVEVEQYGVRDPNSLNMYRGRSHGTVTAYRVPRYDAQGRELSPDAVRKAKPKEIRIGKPLQVYVAEFRTEYPRHNPVSADQVSLRVFQRQFLDYLAKQLARQFHDYRYGSEF
ncbi:MAG: hypothetical protein D6725_11595 [Planctomycetota bacterium]|nr:MAG: hypothetical protein D6725_11595 [Planctomycetota bacterium]